MGWYGDTQYYKGKGVVQHLQEKGYNIIKGKCYRLPYGENVCYAAVQVSDSEIIGVVFKYEFRKIDKYISEFFYKPIQETSGPALTACPKEILQLLSSCKKDEARCSEWARNWRANCWRNIRKTEKAKKWRNKIKVGTVIKVPKDLKGFQGLFDRAKLLNKKRNIWEFYKSDSLVFAEKYKPVKGLLVGCEILN